MKLSLKKGTTYIDVVYTNNNFPYELSCSDFKFDNGQLKTIEFSFEKIIKSLTDSNSKSDLKYFIENIDKVEIIQFSDKTIRNRLLKRFKNNEKVNLKIIAGKILEIEMLIVFGKLDEFELKKRL